MSGTPPVSPISVVRTPPGSPILVAGSPPVSPISVVGHPNALNSPVGRRPSFHIAPGNEGTPGGTPYSNARPVHIEGWGTAGTGNTVGTNSGVVVKKQLGLNGKYPNGLAHKINFSNAAVANVTAGGRRGKKSHKHKKGHKKRRSTRRVRFDRI
jgi:hypothetical protein